MTATGEADPNALADRFLRGEVHSLKLTAKARENQWLEDVFPFGKRPIFRCYVSFRGG